MDLRRITDNSKFNLDRPTVSVPIPKVGVSHLPNVCQVEVFEDRHSGFIYLFSRSKANRTLTITTFVPNEPSSIGDFSVEGGLYDRFVTKREHDNGLDLNRIQSVIWVMSMMAGAARGLDRMEKAS